MWGETIHTLMQYRGVVHCVEGDNTHTNAVGPLRGGRQDTHQCSIGGLSTVWGGDNTHTLMQYRGVVHCVGGDNTHTNAV